MAVISSDPLVNSSDVSIIIDDNETISVTNLRYSQKINSARIVEFSVNSLEDSLKCRLGAKITVLVGRVPPNINTITKTTSVVWVVSLFVGHTTFLISLRASLIKFQAVLPFSVLTAIKKAAAPAINKPNTLRNKDCS